MSGKSFQFKQFTVCQDRCAMKVGTDGVLLGAWADLTQVRRLLDVGTGTGLVTLLCANRFANATATPGVVDVHIDAIDLDADAVEQARDNAAASPWSGHISVSCADINEWKGREEGYDSIVCNPPFYRNSPKSRDAARDMARCCDTLTYEQLAASSNRLLCEGGTLQVVLPMDAKDDMIAACALNGLSLQRETDVVTKEGKPCKRVLMCFVKGGIPRFTKEVLCMFDAEGNKTPEYEALIGDFYLK